MSVKHLELLDEGSWALMIEESNVKALHRYHGSMANLEIDYYLSIGSDRYYKGYFDREQLARVREGIVLFLLDEPTYQRCVSEIHQILKRLNDADTEFTTLGRRGQFTLYCDLLCDYIAYYNSVITDTFYENVFDIIDADLEDQPAFAKKGLKDALFATNNIELLTHLQAVDMLALATRRLNGDDVEKDIERFVETYRSTTISSGSPNGMTPAEVVQHLQQQTHESVQAERAFLDNLHLRYENAVEWSERTAAAIGLSDRTKRLIRHTCELSYLKIRMREEFQKLKVSARTRFLYELIDEIGKQQFDYMRIDEILAFIDDGTRVPPTELSSRRELVVFELDGDDIRLLDALPQGLDLDTGRDLAPNELTGDVLIGSGSRRFRVKKVRQHEEGLQNFDEFIKLTEAKADVAVITNVLRPHLVPKLRQFGALMTQYGGYTSHASVLCRELGINSMISVHGLLDALETDDLIEVDFDRGSVRKLTDATLTKPELTELVVDLCGHPYTNHEVGAKAANLMRISEIATIAEGFVVTSHALKRLHEQDVRDAVLERLASLGSDRVVVRSSHEGEDSKVGSYAGLFDSFVDVDAGDAQGFIDLVRSVHGSQDADAIEKYASLEGEMCILVQEMIAADVSGVILTSNALDGYDYLLLEYVAGGLSHLMQGEVTPLSTYVRKSDVIDGRDVLRAYPAVITDALERSFASLAKIAVELERRFSHRVEIEWAIKGSTIYIFQVRPY